MHIAWLHGFLGQPAEADRWHQLLGSAVRGFPLARAASWREDVDRLSHEVRDCDAVLGYSLGARVALAVAIEHPHAVHQLVLVSGNPGLVSAAERRVRRDRDDGWRRRLLSEPIDRFLRDWYRQPVFACDPPECLDRLREERAAMDRDYQARILERLSIAGQPDYRSRLCELNIPVLCLAGSRDVRYVALAEEMCQQLPHGELRTIADGGHVIHRSHPAECADAIQAFLRRTPGTLPTRGV